MSGKVAKAKEDKDASKGKMRALYVCPWNHIFTRLRSHSSPLCCSDQPVRLDWKQWQHWMANHFPAWCMWLLLAGGWGVIDLRMFCGFGITCTYQNPVRETRQYLCCIDRKKDDGHEMMAGISSCHWHPVEMLLCVSRSHPMCVLSHLIRIGTMERRGPQRSPNSSSWSRPSKTLYVFEERSSENRNFNRLYRIYSYSSLFICFWFWRINQKDSVIYWDLCVSEE